MTKRHEITVKTGHYADSPGHFEARGLIFRIEGSENRAGYGLGGWDQTGEGRIVMHGPMVKGDYAYLFGLAGVIDQRGGTGAIHADAETSGRMFDLAAGDVVSVNGVDFVLSLSSRGYPKLAPVRAIELFEEVGSTPERRLWIAETIEDEFVGTDEEIERWADGQFGPGGWKITMRRKERS